MHDIILLILYGIYLALPLMAGPIGLWMIFEAFKDDPIDYN